MFSARKKYSSLKVNATSASSQRNECIANAGAPLIVTGPMNHLLIPSYSSAYIQKLPNVTNVQMSLLMSFLALFMWWVFDRSEAGLRLSLVFTVVGTIAMQGLVYSDIIR